MAKSTSVSGRGPGRPTNPIRREDLLTIAATAFAEHGYTGTSTAEIARRANLSKASLFHHFPSKEQLYLEVVGNTAKEWLRLLHEAISTNGSILERQDRFNELAIDYFGMHPESARLFLRDMIDFGPFMKSGGWKAVDAALNVAASILEEGMNDGHLREQDPKQLVLSLVGMHLFYFAVPDISSRFTKVDNVFSQKMLEQRTKSVLSQVRALTEND
jgi:TetR/AcrR family transcriptional regulator